MSNDTNLSDKLKADAQKASDKAHEASTSARTKLEGAETKLKADMHKHSDSSDSSDSTIS